MSEHGKTWQNIGNLVKPVVTWRKIGEHGGKLWNMAEHYGTLRNMAEHGGIW